MKSDPMGRLVIRLPEGAVFSLATAGPSSRFLAWLIDTGVLLVAMSVVGLLTGVVGVLHADMGMGIYVLLQFVVTTGYAVALEWFWRGQTLGKRLLRLRVMDMRGVRLRFNQVLIRNLLRAVDILPGCYLVGGTASLITRRNQRLGDLAAGTVVVRAEEVTLPDLERLFPEKYNSLREHPALASRLRQRVGPGEAAVAFRALLRRDALDPIARLDLFRELAAHFRALVPFPEEALEGLTDERYVRNVVEIVFSRR